MTAPRTRYYAFVSRFVDAVVNDAMSSELMRLRRNRVAEAEMLRHVATTAFDTRKAA